MNFKQIDLITFTTCFSGMNDMAEIATRGIRFFNSTFGKLVKEANCEWDAHKITFVLRSHNYSMEEMERRMRGTDYSVDWKTKSFKIQWKQERTADSYHSASSAQELREEYKDRVAYLCSKEDGNWVIDKIVPN